MPTCEETHVDLLWSGWREQLARNEGSDGPWAFLTNRTWECKGLEEAKVVFVDFFPDELTQEKWEQVKAYRGKMVFLPPWVVVGPQKKVNSSKPVVWLATGAKNLPAVEGVFDNDKNLRGLCPTWPIPGKAVAKVLDIRNVTAEDIGQCLPAPAWILSVDDAQTEHALYRLARQHGIRVAYWERTYTSPLRYLTGYEHAFDVVQDKSLRERFKRAYAPGEIAPPPPTEAKLERVMERFGYRALGLAEDGYTWSYECNQQIWQQGLPGAFAQKLALPQTLHTLGVGLQEVLKQAADSTSLALAGRMWQMWVTYVLSMPPDVARERWGVAMATQPTPTLRATLYLMEKTTQAAQWLVMQTALQGAFMFEAPADARAQIADGAQAYGKRWWESNDSTPVMLEIKTLMEILRRKAAPQRSPSASIYEAVWHLRQGSVNEAAQMFESSAAGATPFGYRVALWNTFERPDMPFGKILKAAAGACGVDLAVVYALERRWDMAADKNWRNAHKGRLNEMAQLLKDSRPGSQGASVLELFLWMMVERAGEALEEYRAQAKTLGSSIGMILAFMALNTGQAKEAAELLKLVEHEKLSTSERATYAACQLMAGHVERGMSVLTEVMRESESFWRTTPMDAAAPQKWMLAGMIGKMTGEETIAQKAAERLNLAMWEEKRVAIANAPQNLGGAQLPVEIKQWIAKSL